MKRNKIISILFVLLAIVVLFAGCSKNKTKDEKELKDFNVGLGLTGTAHLLGIIACEQGFAEEEGLNLTISNLNNGNAATLAALESGKIDVAFFGSVPTITFQSAGHDITIIAGAMTNGHGYMVKNKYVPVGFQKGDVSVFKGRNVAAYAKSMQEYQLRYLLREKGIEVGEGPNKTNIIIFGSGTDAWAAFAGDGIDGCVIGVPLSVALKTGQTLVYTSNEVPAFKDIPCCRQVALTKNLAARPEDFIAFERAIIKAYKFKEEHHAETINHVGKYVNLKKDDLDYDIYSGYALANPDPDKKPTITLKKNLVEFGFTDGKDYDIEKQFNTDIYKEALTQILAKYPDDPIYKSLKERFDSNN